MREAGEKLAKRVEALKAFEADRRMPAEHERVEAMRDQLAEEIENMAEPFMQIAHRVRRIEICDREIGRVNATSTAKFGYIPLVLSASSPSIAALFRDCLVSDAFIAVAGLQSPPAASGGQARRTGCSRSEPILDPSYKV